MAGPTGLEPATSAVTGQRSNQLSYDSNPRNAKLEPITMPFNQKMGTVEPVRGQIQLSNIHELVAFGLRVILAG